MVYLGEDSFLLSEAVSKYLLDKPKNIRILDMGSGSGIQAEACKKLGFNNLTVVDIDLGAIKLLRKKGFKAVKSDLFNKIKGKFDIVIFNAPYLPESKYDSQPDTTGGKKGYEVIVKFLKQAKQHLTEKGVILLLFSSFSHPLIIKEKSKELGYRGRLLSKKKLFFEELYVYELQIKNT